MCEGQRAACGSQPRPLAVSPGDSDAGHQPWQQPFHPRSHLTSPIDGSRLKQLSPKCLMTVLNVTILHIHYVLLWGQALPSPHISTYFLTCRPHNSQFD